MSRYVIELGERLTGESGSSVQRVKGFNSLVFDEEGLRRLTPLDTVLEDSRKLEYQRGLFDAWRLARKLVNLSISGHLVEMFDSTRTEDVILDYDVNDVRSKVKDYESVYGEVDDSAR